MDNKLNMNLKHTTNICIGDIVVIYCIISNKTIMDHAKRGETASKIQDIFSFVSPNENRDKVV